MIALDRRGLLAGIGALGLTASSAWAAPLPLREAARRAALYGLPLIEMATTRRRTLGRAAVNGFNHVRTLRTAKDRNVTRPNNDTLYSSAWIDLSQGPVRIVLPPTGDRYFSLALMDMYTNNFAVLGTRATGTEGGEFLLVGPAAPLPAGAAIRSPTDWVWALGRTLIAGESDLPAAHAVQDAIRLEGPAGRKPGAYAPREAPWPDYFAAVQALLDESPPPATDARLFHDIQALGLGSVAGFNPARFSVAQSAEIAAGLAEALEAAKGGGESGEVRAGWVYPRGNIGDYGQDYHYRAQVALGGLAALPIAEALYMAPHGPDGGTILDSRQSWTLRFPGKALPPVDAFWSMTLYEMTPAGQGFFVDNPLNRYSISDRTQGLLRTAEGSIDIWISATDPGPARRTNWLPAPTNGAPMALSLRAYLPRPELATGRYRLPSLECV
ncbi:MAG: DUF1254 domain-containing protein [Caulobacter sp.]